MNGGYTLTYRSIQSHWLWQGKPFSDGQAWLDLVMLAAFKDHEVKAGRTLKRGELWATYRILGERWGWSKDRVARFIRKLESCGMVNAKRDRKRDTGGTLIFIVKYDHYQAGQRDTEDDANETQTRHKRDYQKEGKNEKTGTDVNGRSHSTHQVSTTTPDTGVQAGASRPSLHRQAETNDNRTQENTLATQKPTQANATATNRLADGPTSPPAADRSIEPNAASGKAGSEVAKPYATPAPGAQVAKPDRADRSDEVKCAISRLGEILRRGGWHEEQVRRVLRWLIGWKCGAWIRTASEGAYWRVAAQAIGVHAQAKASGTVRDEVSLLISLMDKDREPREEHYRTAKAQWLGMDDDPERGEPIYMREVYAEIGKPVPPPQAQRSMGEYKLSFDGAAGV